MNDLCVFGFDCRTSELVEMVGRGAVCRSVGGREFL
jgi:hypothetical protein